MRPIDLIVVHCTACPPGVNSTVADIRRGHMNKGWDDIGYHYLIRLDGSIEIGRPLEKAGAHAYGHNTGSIGVAYVGGRDGDTRTHEQKVALLQLIRTLRRLFPHTRICGHRDLPRVAKACPNFNVGQWLATHNIPEDTTCPPPASSR